MLALAGNAGTPVFGVQRGRLIDLEQLTLRRMASLRPPTVTHAAYRTKSVVVPLRYQAGTPPAGLACQRPSKRTIPPRTPHKPRQITVNEGKRRTIVCHVCPAKKPGQMP